MSYTRNLYHIIFRTKFGEPTILEQNEEHLYRYIWHFVTEHKSVLYRINGMPDHLHLFVDLHPTIAIAEFVKLLKTASHDFIDKNKTLFPDFYAWSVGYCALTYSENEKAKIVAYIKNQKEHHQTVNFTDEVKHLLIETGIEIKTDFFDRDL